MIAIYPNETPQERYAREQREAEQARQFREGVGHFFQEHGRTLLLAAGAIAVLSILGSRR